MRIIQKQISLEPMTSRLPSVWPAYLDNDHKIYFFDDESLSGRSYLHTSNWGMVPLNIAVTPKPSSAYTYAKYSGVTDCDIQEDKLVLSFENLSKWYYFFTEYYRLLNGYGHCNRVYTSAEDYYNYESLTKYADQMIYGTDKQTYLDLDAEFADKGGRAYFDVYNKEKGESDEGLDLANDFNILHDKNTVITNAYDYGFFKWICEHVVPSFVIPKEYRDYWKKDALFYPDVVKWLAWFQERYEIYLDKDGEANIANWHVENGVEFWDCKGDNVNDCCDCEEYFKRGGYRTYSGMKAWYDAVQKNIIVKDDVINSEGEIIKCMIPTIINPIELQVSIDDLGGFDIFSKEYELGTDYRVAHYGDSANTYSGTVSTIEGESMILSSDSAGYEFNQDYMDEYVSKCLSCGYEGVFSDKCPKCGSNSVEIIGWKRYTDKYVNDNREEFYVSGITFYTFDENNVKYTSSESSEFDARMELQSKLTKRYSLVKGDWVLIDGVLYSIGKSEYGEYDKNNAYMSGRTFLVYREEGTNTPYTYVNGVKIYADYYSPTNVFYFPFFPSDNASTSDGRSFSINNYKTFNRYVDDDGDFKSTFEYNGSIYVIEDSEDYIEIDDNTYYRVSAYTETEDNDTLYCISGNVEWYSDFGLDNYEIEGYETPIICANTIDIAPSSNTFSVFNVDEITGRTVSKLQDLRVYNVLTDDIGNTIEGVYVTDGTEKNHQPPEGIELEPIYQVGNVANINRFSETKDISTGADRNYYIGDIITSMIFYYVNYEDKIEEHTITKVSLMPNDKILINYQKGTHWPTGNTWAEFSAETSGYTSLEAINYANQPRDILNADGKTCYDDIYCDITYNIGATLCRKEGSNFYNLALDNRCKNHGVEYTETVRFIKTNWEYYLKKPKDASSVLPKDRNNPCVHSISYPICVYLLDQGLERVDESQYDTTYSVPMADFRVDINVFRRNRDTFSAKYPNEMARHNDMQVFPIYREEYKLGVASLENVDADIYIERGINAAYEKHLKLGEVTSLESLEQYGNNFFKIMQS